MGDNPHPGENPPVLSDEIFTFNGAATTPDINGQRPVNQAVGLSLSTGNGVADWVSESKPVPMREGGTYAYAAGTSPTTVDVPSLARLRRVSVIASGGGSATVAIGGGAVITIPASGNFDEQIPGTAVGSDVVIGGSVLTYYVSWVL